jgi:U4/U6 small nuclear ribonucleoprotein PRP4
MNDQFAIPKPKTNKLITEESTDLGTYKKEVALYTLKRAAVRVHSLAIEKLKTDPIKEEENIEAAVYPIKNYSLELIEYADTSAVSKGVLSCNDSFFTTAGWSGEVKVWKDLSKPTIVTSLVGHKYQVFDVDFHPNVVTNDPDIPNIVTGGADCLVRLWTFDTAEKEQNFIELSGHEERINKTKFHPNGLNIVSASYDKTAIIWDIEKEKSLAQLKGHTAPVHALSIHPDGSLMVYWG